MDGCDRCGGLMVWDPLAVGDYDVFSLNIFKCVACGNRVDSVIVSNRAKPVKQRRRLGEVRKLTQAKRNDQAEQFALESM